MLPFHWYDTRRVLMAKCSIQKIVTSNTFQNCKLARCFAPKMASKYQWIRSFTFTVDAVTGIFHFRYSKESIQHSTRFRCAAFTYVLRMHLQKKNIFRRISQRFISNGFSMDREHSTHLKYKCHCVIVANDMAKKEPLVPTDISTSVNRAVSHTLLHRLDFLTTPIATHKIAGVATAATTIPAVAIVDVYTLYLRLLSKTASCFSIAMLYTNKMKRRRAKCM